MSQMMYDEPHKLEDYLATELQCSCGHKHYVPIRAVEIGPGAIRTLPDYTRKFGYAHPYIVCDEITHRIAGEKCATLLHEAGVESRTLILKHTGFDEATLGEIVLNLPEDCDVMIGVGTGSITDMIRFSSYKLKLPCFTVATGAPMDGFAASIGIMNVNNLKKTMQAHTTELIIGDTDILKTAPYRMTVAGFGDLIGKITCQNDWELGRIINGEHYCKNIADLVKDCLAHVLEIAPRIKDRDPDALGDVMNGLVLSGASISLYGNSRPASGAEHHMSHYWETVMEQRGMQHAMHGEQVAVGTVLVLMLIEELLKKEIDFDRARDFVKKFDRKHWEAEIRRTYGTAADEVIEIENSAGKNTPENCLRRIDSMQQHWQEICEQLKTMPSAEYLMNLLKEIGCPYLPSAIGIDAATLKDTFLYCKEVRARYTVFQTVYDLGLLDELSDGVQLRLNRIEEET